MWLNVLKDLCERKRGAAVRLRDAAASLFNWARLISYIPRTGRRGYVLRLRDRNYLPNAFFCLDALKYGARLFFKARRVIRDEFTSIAHLCPAGFRSRKIRAECSAVGGSAVLFPSRCSNLCPAVFPSQRRLTLTQPRLTVCHFHHNELWNSGNLISFRDYVTCLTTV